MTDKRCDQCVYWTGPIYPQAEGGRDGGDCRIGPPERSAGRYDTGISNRGRWPLTLADEYCHAFYPKDAPPEDDE